MTTFVNVFFIVLGVYLLAVFVFGVIKYFVKRKDNKEKQKDKDSNSVK